MILNSPTISGSLTVTGNIIASGSITLSGSVASASYASNAELLDGLDSTVFTLTSSFAAQTASFTAFTASILSYTASQNILNGKYATTGSNTFTGIQTVNSNLVVTGSITAQTLIVQTITSSVDFVTGSTRFGSLSSDTMKVTGSLLVTGSSTLSGSIATTGNITLNKTSPNIFMRGGYTQDLGFFLNSEPAVYIVDDATATKGMKVNISTGAITQLGSGSVSFTGAATFASSVQSTAMSIGVTPTSNILYVAGENNTFDGTIRFGQRGYLQHRDAGSTTTSLANDYNSDSAKMEFRMKGNTTSDAKMTILGSGQVGIGTSIFNYTDTGQGYLAIQGTSSTFLEFQWGTTNTTGWIQGSSSTLNIMTSGNKDLLLGTVATARIRIQDSGTIAFGEYANTTGTSYKFRFNGNGAGDVMAVVVNNPTAGSTSYIAFRTGTGEGSYKADIRYESGNLSLNGISDIRFKENIKDASISEQWNKVKNSKLRIFDFKDKTCSNQLGFIAQELYQTIPEAISKGGDEEEFNGNEKSIWTIASTNLIPTMFGALQEAMAKIETLQTQNDALQSRIETLESK